MKIKNNKGFSIIELSISLTIIGIIILFTMSSLQAIADNNAVATTEARLEKITNRIVNSITRATSSSTSSSNGTVDFRLPKPEDVAPLAYETDGYGNYFDYIPATKILDLAGSSYSSICTTRSTDLDLHVKEIGETSYKEYPSIAFMVIGKGANFTKDYDNSTTGIVKLDRDNRKNDDVFRYVTLDELKFKLGCVFGKDNEIEIITKDLPPLKNGTIARIATNKPSDKYSIFGWRYGHWCLSHGARDALVDNIAFHCYGIYDDFDLNSAIETDMIRNECTGGAMSGDCLGQEVGLSRKPNAIPGTYKMTVRAVFGRETQTKVDDSFVVTIPFN